MDAVIHRGVSMVLVADAALAVEIMSARGMARFVAGRLGDRCILLKPGSEAAAVEQMRKLGHTPGTLVRAADPPPLVAQKVVKPPKPSKPMKVKVKGRRRVRKRGKGSEPGYVKFNRPTCRK